MGTRMGERKGKRKEGRLPDGRTAAKRRETREVSGAGRPGGWSLGRSGAAAVAARKSAMADALVLGLASRLCRLCASKLQGCESSLLEAPAPLGIFVFPPPKLNLDTLHQQSPNHHTMPECKSSHLLCASHHDYYLPVAGEAGNSASSTEVLTLPAASYTSLATWRIVSASRLNSDHHGKLLPLSPCT